MSVKNDVSATYLGRDNPEPRYMDYYPAWLDQLAEDATVEGSMIDGAVQGRERVRAVVLAIRSLYGDSQEWNFAGPYGDANGWLEDYVARVGGDPIACVVLVKRNDRGQAQHVLASYRPRTSVIHFAQRLREHFAGTSLAEYFGADEP